MDALNKIKQQLGEDGFKDWALSFETQEELTNTLQKREVTDKDKIRVIIGAVKRVGGLGGIQGSGPTDPLSSRDQNQAQSQFIAQIVAEVGKELKSKKES